MATTAAKAPATRTNVMENFTWEGTDKRGVKMKGETSAKSAALLRAELRKQGINPTVVRTKSKPLFGKSGKAITAQDISVFSRQIATMLQAGVPMVQSFEILASGQKNPRMRDMSTSATTSPAAVRSARRWRGTRCSSTCCTAT
jgi:type IV pilus assembly protein PilC